MSVTNPEFTIPRRSVEQPHGEVGMYVKMWDPPTESPPTPEFLDLENLPAGVKANPVPEVMAAAGYQSQPSRPHTVMRDLMHGIDLPTWDGNSLTWFLIRDGDNPATGMGNFPGATIRMPRGVIFQCEMSAHGPPPHTIHWHGIEPTPMNDGVGHCSMELGHYIYQWQPNHMGVYHYHCHRNTVQHFEFGLYGGMIFEAPDAYFASIASTNPNGSVNLNGIPIGAGTDGKKRVACNLDPAVTGRPNPFPGFTRGIPVGIENGDPHAYTVPYDVEALWVVDDRDSVWSDFAPDARAYYPSHGSQPGVNDTFFHGIFHDFNADYWFVTGVPVPAHRIDRGGTGFGVIDPVGAGLPDGLIPPEINSGISGTRIAINARLNQTILIRVLDAAYNYARVTFPFPVAVIAFDGRALGVPPFGNYNTAFLLPAGRPILLSTARRFDCITRFRRPFNGFANVEFLDTQSRTNGPGPRLMTAQIPITIIP